MSHTLSCLSVTKKPIGTYFMKKVRLGGDGAMAEFTETEVAMPGFKCLSSNSKSSQVGEE